MKRISLSLWNDDLEKAVPEARIVISHNIDNQHQTVMIDTHGSRLTKQQIKEIAFGFPQDKLKIKGPLSPLAYSGDTLPQ